MFCLDFLGKPFERYTYDLGTFDVLPASRSFGSTDLDRELLHWVGCTCFFLLGWQPDFNIPWTSFAEAKTTVGMFEIPEEQDPDSCIYFRSVTPSLLIAATVWGVAVVKEPA